MMNKIIFDFFLLIKASFDSFGSIFNFDYFNSCLLSLKINILTSFIRFRQNKISVLPVIKAPWAVPMCSDVVCSPAKKTRFSFKIKHFILLNVTLIKVVLTIDYDSRIPLNSENRLKFLVFFQGHFSKCFLD
jgi:hypothetical protein